MNIIILHNENFMCVCLYVFITQNRKNKTLGRNTKLNSNYHQSNFSFHLYILTLKISFNEDIMPSETSQREEDKYYV